MPCRGDRKTEDIEKQRISHNVKRKTEQEKKKKRDKNENREKRKEN